MSLALGLTVHGSPEAIQYITKSMEDIELFPHVATVLKELKASGYRLGIITNSMSTREEKVEQPRAGPGTLPLLTCATAALALCPWSHT